MDTTLTSPSLGVLDTLRTISEFLSGREQATKTAIRNSLELTEEAVTAAIEFGSTNGFLERREYNYIKLLAPYQISEDAFYPCVELALCELWRSDGYADHSFYLEKTARRDSKIVGPWTRPDFTMVSHKKYPWTIGHEFDVVTFEVKRPDSCNVLAVFEALSHSSNATRAYVVFPINEDNWMEYEPAQAGRVKDECSRHGVGLILIEDPYDAPTPRYLLKAERREIDHAKCSDFLGAVLSDDGKKMISGWK